HGSVPAIYHGEVMSEINDQLSKFIATNILKQPSRTIAEDEKLISSGLIDSFNLMDLALFVEDTYGVRIEDTELNADTFDSLNQLTALIESRR
ncbi:MAG TPA: acyl carrier protein, partial [Anaerolineales bacterium]|nr:acyl carrier protein [Anaerolineales bacterium]